LSKGRLLNTLGFLKDTPSGSLTLTDFQSIFRIFSPFQHPDTFASLVFKAFDTDRSGSINFRQFLVQLSITSRGSLEEKLTWAFGLYDVSDNGKISYDDMLIVVQAIYEMV
jgi:Ca2+-binding EF-hand superfamily protein